MQKLEMYRLIADEGKLITNGESEPAACIDVFPASDADKYYEVDAPAEAQDGEVE